jgi:hypothetical protein
MAGSLAVGGAACGLLAMTTSTPSLAVPVARVGKMAITSAYAMAYIWSAESLFDSFSPTTFRRTLLVKACFTVLQLGATML